MIPIVFFTAATVGVLALRGRRRSSDGDHLDKDIAALARLTGERPSDICRRTRRAAQLQLRSQQDIIDSEIATLVQFGAQVEVLEWLQGKDV